MSKATNEWNFSSRVAASVKAAGLPPFVSGVAIEESHRRDALVDGQIGAVLVRFRRDRGQEEVEFRWVTEHAADAFPLCDIEVALGWLLPGDVWKADHLEVLASVLERLSARWTEVEESLAGPHRESTWAAVAAARDERVASFKARLAAIAKGCSGTS